MIMIGPVSVQEFTNYSRLAATCVSVATFHVSRHMDGWWFRVLFMFASYLFVILPMNSSMSLGWLLYRDSSVTSPSLEVLFIKHV